MIGTDRWWSDDVLNVRVQHTKHSTRDTFLYFSTLHTVYEFEHFLLKHTAIDCECVAHLLKLFQSEWLSDESQKIRSYRLSPVMEVMIDVDDDRSAWLQLLM